LLAVAGKRYGTKFPSVQGTHQGPSRLGPQFTSRRAGSYVMPILYAALEAIASDVVIAVQPNQSERFTDKPACSVAYRLKIPNLSHTR